MWDKLESIFQKLGIDYFRQGSFMPDEKLPDSLFTFWNANTPEMGFYDGEAHRAVWYWYVYFYTKNPSLIYSKMEEFITLAKEAGFVVEGKARDAPIDDENYCGRYVLIKYIEIYKE